MTIAATSPSGLSGTWTLRSLPVAAFWTDVAWNGFVFCAIGNNGTSNSNIVATSPDGITWKSGSFPVSAQWKSLAAMTLP